MKNIATSISNLGSREPLHQEACHKYNINTLILHHQEFTNSVADLIRLLTELGDAGSILYQDLEVCNFLDRVIYNTTEGLCIWKQLRIFMLSSCMNNLRKWIKE